MANATDQFKLVFGDEWMALYRNGELAAEGVHLTFADVIDAARLTCEMEDADIEWAHKRTGYPAKLSEVEFEGGEAV